MSNSRSNSAAAAATDSLFITRRRQIEKLRGALHQTDPNDRPARDATTRAAAVLVPIVQREDDLYLVFIRRSDSVESHRGQVAFPGGRVDPTDTTLLHTALREAHEEVGIEPAVVDVLGGFPTMSTVSSGMLVAPFVGVLKGAGRNLRAGSIRAEGDGVFEIFDDDQNLIGTLGMSDFLNLFDATKET